MVSFAMTSSIKHINKTKAKAAAFELIKHPHHIARDFTSSESRILHKCLFNREYLKMHAIDLLNDPDYLSKMANATKLESFLNLELLTEAWNFAVFESLFDDSDRFILCEEYLDVKSVCLKTICQVRLVLDDFFFPFRRARAR